MTKTYTYTARSLEDPDKVITFTIFGDELRVDLSNMLEKIESVSEAENKREEIQTQIRSQAKPVVARTVESVTGPVHISDVSASLDDSTLTVNTWKRAGGLRLAPVTFRIQNVDNKEAAQAFVRELKERKGEVEPAKKLFGPLDYWFSWIGLILGAVFTSRWLLGRAKSE